MENQVEVWKSHPNIAGVEVSTFGRVRTLDKVTSSENRTRFTKGRILKQYESVGGYRIANIPIDRKLTTKLVHRIVAETFIPNPNNLPQINHKNGDKTNNNASNLGWCTTSYNAKYRERFGKALGHPLFAINLSTLEVSRFPSQKEAGRSLGIFQTNINAVLKGKLKQTGGYWFVNADDTAVDIAKHKLHDIGKTGLTATDTISQDFISQLL